MLIRTTDFKACVLEAFDQLHMTWNSLGDDKSFWRTGNALDACVNFMVEAQKAWGAGDSEIKKRKTYLQDIVRDSFKEFRSVYCQDSALNFVPGEGTIDGKQVYGNWWDDYGWWGIAFLRTYEYFNLLFDTISSAEDCYNQSSAIAKDCCLRFAHDCWRVLHEHAWDREQYGITPPIQGGCWNRPPTQGIQNTVTNALFLALSIRLYKATKGMIQFPSLSQNYLNAACAQYRWFGEWFALKQGIQDSYLLNNELFYLVLERPVDESEYNKIGDPPYAKQLWTGDQGLILGGLVDLVSAADAVSKNKEIIELDSKLQARGLNSLGYASELIEWIVHGITRLFTSDPKVLHEAPLSDAFIINYFPDYATGKGVLMRYLAYSKPGLNVNFNYDDYFVDVAKAICEHSSEEKNGFGFIWDNRTERNDITPVGTNEAKFISYGKAVNEDQWKFSTQTARLDALTAAVPLRKE